MGFYIYIDIYISFIKWFCFSEVTISVMYLRLFYFFLAMFLEIPLYSNQYLFTH